MICFRRLATTNKLTRPLPKPVSLEAGFGVFFFEDVDKNQRLSSRPLPLLQATLCDSFFLFKNGLSAP